MAIGPIEKRLKLQMSLSLVVVFLFLLTTLQGEVLPQGLPIHERFTQNQLLEIDTFNCAYQGPEGVMFFGSEVGLFEYDGSKWRHYEQTPDKIKWLKMSQDGTLFVGADHDFGKMLVDENGSLQFETLLAVQSELPPNSYFSEYELFGDTLFVSTSRSVYALSLENQSWQTLASEVYLHGFVRFYDRLFLMFETKIGFAEWDGSTLLRRANPAGMQTRDSFSAGVAVGQDRLFLTTFHSGPYLFDGERFENAPNPLELASLDTVRVNDIHALSKNEVVIATNGSGLYLINLELGTSIAYPYLTNFLRDSVLDLAQDDDEGLWLVSQRECIRIQELGQAGYYDYTHGIEGTPNSLAMHAGSLWLGTTNGLFRSSDGANGAKAFEPVDTRKGKVVTLVEVDGDLFALRDEVIDVYSDGNLSQEIPNVGYRIAKPAAEANRIYLGGIRQFGELVRSGGAWKLGRTTGRIERKIEDIAEDENGDVWVSTGTGPIGYVNMDVSEFRVLLLEDLLKGSEWINQWKNVVQLDDDRVYVSIGGASYRLVPSELRVEPNEEFFLGKTNRISYFNFEFMDRDRGRWVQPEKGKNLLRIPLTRQANAIAMVGIHSSKTANSIVHDSNNEVFYVAGDLGVVYFREDDASEDFDRSTRITRILDTRQNRTIYGGFGRLDTVIEIERGLESLKIEYTNSRFGFSRFSQYATSLEGKAFSSEQPMGVEAARELGVIPKGSYRFKIASQSFDGVLSAAEIGIFVKPHPLETALAKGAYGLAVAILLWGLYQWRMNRARLLNQKLELEVAARTREVESKSEELFRSLKTSEALTRKAKASDVSKSLFLANMSHEIRTPMNGVIGMCYVLELGELDAEQTENVQIIKNSSNRLLRLIDDILDFSKIEAGKLDMESVSFDLLQHLDETIDLLAHGARLGGVDLQLEVDWNIQPIRIGDPTRLGQVFANLIGNAIKFTKEGVVRISAIESNAEDGFIEFHVIDSGIGIDPERLGTLFAPYTQADKSTTRKFGGTGLGLSISSEIVKLMRGQIEVISKVGEGSDFGFKVYLPADGDNEIETARERWSELSGNRSMHVVTQLESVRGIFERVSQNDSSAVFVNSFTELKRLRKSPDNSLFVIDYDACSLEEIDSLKLDTPFNSVPTILVYSTMNEFIAKLKKTLDCVSLRSPLSPSKLADKLELLLNNERKENV